MYLCKCQVIEGVGQCCGGYGEGKRELSVSGMMVWEGKAPFDEDEGK